MSKRRKEIFFGLNGSVIRFFQAHSKKFKCHFCLKSHLSFVLFAFDRNDFFWSIEFYALCLRWRTTFMCRSILFHFQQIHKRAQLFFSAYVIEQISGVQILSWSFLPSLFSLTDAAICQKYNRVKNGEFKRPKSHTLSKFGQL